MVQCLCQIPLWLAGSSREERRIAQGRVYPEREKDNESLKQTAYLDAWKVSIIIQTHLEDSLHIKKTQKYLVFCSICTIFAPLIIEDRATAFWTSSKSPQRIKYTGRLLLAHTQIWVWALAVSICVRGVVVTPEEEMFLPLLPASFFIVKISTIIFT